MKEILKEKTAAAFYRKVMAWVQNYDKDFSKLSLYFQKTGTGDRLKISKPHFACSVDALPKRKSDYDDSVTWTYKGKTYCLYLEFTREDLDSAFIPKFNTAYTNEFLIKNNENEYILISLQEDVSETVDKKNQSDGVQSNVDFEQKILFGAPGTGKSFKIDDPEKGYGLKVVDESRKFRTTFHPDYDYAQFVGAYKPKKCGDNITYSFVPQVFAKAYAEAWMQFFDAGNTSTAKNQVYLVIEEINRGNCAQIFGDVFQLLDRDSDGFSQYSIDADCDFAEWLEKEFTAANLWDAYKKKVGGEGKLKLPPNLNILATMNTSDQSLFPMDSAFKRRFDWEYVPISFDGKDAANFQIDIDGTQYSWQKFVETVNEKILTLTESEDKQLGEFFIKPDNGNVISKDRFLGKVMFYLWNEICKDEHKNGSFFRVKDKDGKEDYFTFQDLYRNKDLLKQFMEELLNGKP